MAWAALGLISAGYMGVFAWLRTSNLEVALAPVTETLERLANDIADLKKTTANIDARERANAERARATETRLESFAQLAANLPQTAQNPSYGQRPTNRAVLAEGAPVAAVPQPTPVTTLRIAGIEVSPAPAASVRQPTTVTPPPAPPILPAKPVAAPAVAKPVAHALPTVAPIQTGSLPAAVPARSPGLLVASGPSLESIRLSWTVLSQTHGTVLGALEPRLVPSNDGSAFQLIAGPFATDAEALKACLALKARGVGCKPAEYTGAPL